MSAETVINGVMDEVEARIVTALGITADQVFEDVESFEGITAAAFVSGEIVSMQSMGLCNDQAELQVTIGFRIADDPDVPKRVQRMAKTLALRSALVWGPNTGTKIPDAGLPMVTDLAVSGLGMKARDGWILGGLTWRAQLVLPRGT